ncbi:hypothetical protein [Flagellimonas aurea]|uniref:hypothetical protein n=1 Tax=Flagellimonas aurea TaxID=2915619 RepID=UPI0035CEE084
MNLNQAVKRLSWKFRNQKTFKVYRDDIEAWNFILEALNSHVDSRVSKNQIAGKFIIEYYKQLIQFYDTDVFDDIPIKELAKIAEKPLERHFDDFTSFLNNREQIRISEGIELSKMSRDEVKAHLQSIEEAGRSFSKGEVKKNSIQIISETLRKYGQDS